MKTCFVDTNLFIRYLTNDDPGKADSVEKLLDQASGSAEVNWRVLESYYKLKKEQIAEMIQAMLATPGLEIINGKLVEKAVNYYVSKNIDFIDAYIISLMEKLDITGIYSFDKKHLSKITAINRLVP